MALRFGFLPCDVNPFGTVFFRNDVVFRQVCQVSPADACEYRKDKQVACVAQAVCGQFGIEQFFKLFPVQVAVVYRHFLNLMSCKRVTFQYMLLQRQPCHLVQQDKVVIIG